MNNKGEFLKNEYEQRKQFLKKEENFMVTDENSMQKPEDDKVFSIIFDLVFLAVIFGLIIGAFAFSNHRLEKRLQAVEESATVIVFQSDWFSEAQINELFSLGVSVEQIEDWEKRQLDYGTLLAVLNEK